MAINSSSGMTSAGTKLYYANAGEIAFVEVANVKTTPEVGGQPQQLEVTNLGDETQRYDLGMNSSTVLAFSIVYKGPAWNDIYSKEGNRKVYDWKIVYPDGMYITFSGSFQISVQSVDVNTPLMYTLNVSPTVAPQFHNSKSNDSSAEGGESSAMTYRPMFVKTFDSVDAMNAYSDEDGTLIQGDFVLVSGDNADRGKVYFYTGSGFTFFSNIIGPQGVQGPKGEAGQGVKMLGQKNKLPALANEGELCFVDTTLYSYTNGTWINLGDFKGRTGDTGSQGPSAYQLAVNNGYQGTEEAWITSLKGEKGDTGSIGLAGAQGPKGDAGPQGLKGDTGATGPMPDMTGYATNKDVESASTANENYTDTQVANSVKNGDQIGGRNYLLDSRLVASIQGNNDSSWQTLKRITLSSYPMGKTVTWSYDVTIDSSDSGQMYLQFDDKWSPAWQMPVNVYLSKLKPGEKTHFSFTGVFPTQNSKNSIMEIGLHASTSKVTVENMKIELGAIETDWSPAPEDMVSQSDLQATINMLKSYVDGKIPAS